MSLREEIQDIIYKKIGGKEHVGIRWTECQEATNEVVSIIKKRIDSILKEEPHMTIDYAEGFARACIRIREMLK